MGGGGKSDLASAVLFSAFDVMWCVSPSLSTKFRVVILVLLPSVGASVVYLFAIQISFSEVFSNSFSQCSFFVVSMSFT